MSGQIYGVVIPSSQNEGRFEFYSTTTRYELHAGDSIALLFPERRRIKVVETRIEHDGEKYYAVGQKKIPLLYCWARVSR